MNYQKKIKSLLKSILQNVILIVIICCTMFSCQSQNKNTTRYYEAAYFGQDSANEIRYGSYFFSVSNNNFPSIEETRGLIIADYKLKFTATDKRMTIWIVEFKNKKEWLKWNHK